MYSKHYTLYLDFAYHINCRYKSDREHIVNCFIHQCVKLTNDSRMLGNETNFAFVVEFYSIYYHVRRLIISLHAVLPKPVVRKIGHKYGLDILSIRVVVYAAYVCNISAKITCFILSAVTCLTNLCHLHCTISDDCRYGASLFLS